MAILPSVPWPLLLLVFLGAMCYLVAPESVKRFLVNTSFFEHQKQQWRNQPLWVMRLAGVMFLVFAGFLAWNNLQHLQQGSK